MQCILHIGTEKTGSTSIQYTLKKNGPSLRKQGIHYCRSLNRPNNRHVSTCCMRLERCDDSHKELGLLTAHDRSDFNRKIWMEFENEIKSVEGFARIFLISSEHCHSRLIHSEEVECVKRILQKYFSDIKIVVYLRPQIDLEISMYSTVLRTGGRRSDACRNNLDPHDTYFDYASLTHRWESVFGTANMIVRNYAEIGSVVSDFLDVCGIELQNKLHVGRTNEKLSLEQVAFLRHINQYLPLFIDNRKNPLRGRIESFIEDLPFTRGVTVEREVAIAFQRKFDESNEEVRKQYFPNKSQLFEIDFEGYPESIEHFGMSIEQHYRIFAHAWKKKQEQVMFLQRQIDGLRVARSEQE